MSTTQQLEQELEKAQELITVLGGVLTLATDRLGGSFEVTNTDLNQATDKWDVIIAGTEDGFRITLIDVQETEETTE